MPSRTHRTKVMDPIEWAFPPQPLRHREVRHQSAVDGDGSRPPLLFVHGLSHGAWCWAEHWMPAAAERGWESYALSLRGHGASEGHDDIRKWTLRDYAHDVMQAIVDLPAPPVLVGQSMGALVVQRVLERYPAPAAALLTPAGNTHGLGIFAGLARRRPLQAARAAALQPIRLCAEDLFASLPADEARRHLDRLTEDSPLAQLQITMPRRGTTARCPVLVLGAGEDRLIPLIDVVRTAARFGTRPHVFAGMGHDLMLESGWERPLNLLLEWLEGQDLRPPARAMAEQASG
jgi:pimeloyl-ACP methyl ester carboxylesterase